MTYNLIVATNEDFVIGIDNKLPWKSKKELKYFKKITTDNVVIMGRKTHESIGKPLNNRVNIVISNTKTFEDVITVKSFDEALKEAYTYNKEVFVIGGASLYEQTIDNADKLYITWVHEKSLGIPSKGDSYFKGYKETEWMSIEDELVLDDEVNLMFEVFVKNTPQNKVKYRCIDIIKSCVTPEQFNTAKNYINQYLTMYSDEKGYDELLDLLNFKNPIND
jgi:dihydrofolate reductase